MSAHFDIAPRNGENSFVEMRAKGFIGGRMADIRQPAEMNFKSILTSPQELSRIVCNSDATYVRERSDVRAETSNSFVIWIVRRGSLTVNHSWGSRAVDDCSLTALSLDSPFRLSLHTDERGKHESYQLVLNPTDVAAEYGLLRNSFGSFSTLSSTGMVATSALTCITETAEHASPTVAASLATALKDAILQLIREGNGEKPPRETLSERHFTNAVNHIDRNISNRDIRHAEIARLCGVSERHLSYVLKKKRITFSRLLWTRRLELANTLLRDPLMGNYPVSRISDLAGFKSSAHFSRAFKAAFGLSPSHARPNKTSTLSDWD